MLEIMSITRIRDIKNREDAIMFLKEMGIIITPDMTQEEIDDVIRSEIGLDFNIPERPMFDYSKIKIPEDTESSETHAAPTPNGGAYSTAYYYDANHMPCKKEEARYRDIVEYSEFGERINENYGIIER